MGKDDKDLQPLNNAFISIILSLINSKVFLIGNNCLFYRACEINAWDKYKGFDYSPLIEIGDNCQFGPYTHITCCNKIIIGNGVLTGSNVIISDNNHGSLTKEDIKGQKES